MQKQAELYRGKAKPYTARKTRTCWCSNSAMIRQQGMARALSSLIARYGEQQVQLLHYEQTG